MPIKLSEMNEELYSTVLTVEEDLIFKDVSNFIDAEIKARYGGLGSEVYIKLDVADFTKTTDSKWYRNLRLARRQVMHKNLEKIYEDAGWSIRTEIVGGPTIADSNYWVLSGKD